MKGSFREWLDFNFYPGFDISGLTDEELYRLEDEYYEDQLEEDEEDEEIWNS